VTTSQARPLISVVSPTLNASAFVRDLLASVDHQTYPNVEHVVVDGCSTDGTTEILAAAPADRRRVIVRKDRSMYDAINHGIEQSRGEIVSCLNADDLYFPDAVSYMVDFFRNNPETDVAYGNQLTLFTAASSFDPYVTAEERSDPWGDVLVYVTQPAVFVRRRVFDRVGLFDPDYRCVGDFDFWIRAYRAGAVFRKFDRTVVIVRIHGGNLTSSDRWTREHEALKDRYLPSGWRRRLAEAYRLALRRLTVNQFTSPFLVELPERFVRFDRGAYFRYLFTRRPTVDPVLTIDLPYFQFRAHRALNFAEASPAHNAASPPDDRSVLICDPDLKLARN
jgi:glycosyltransferase involved in cell wall biosynthesis